MVKKEPQQPIVRNLVTLAWYDEEGNVQTYEKRLHPPKGRLARLTLPKVLRFMGELADVQGKLDKLDSENVLGQMQIIEDFFTFEHEELFPFILQLETDQERAILDENLNAIVVLEAVTTAAQFIIEESFNRPEVKEALKKSGGDAQAETAS